MLFWNKLFSKIGVSSSKEKMRVIVSGLLALKKVEETDIALKNGNMKLVKSLFEDVEILMPTSNFNKHGKLDQPSSSQSCTLFCPNCGKRYIVGENSILVSDENLMEAFFQAGGIGILGTQARKPDLAINKGNLSPLERQKALENIQRIKQDLRQGLSRTWSCFHCSDNAYPKLGGIGLEPKEDIADYWFARNKKGNICALWLRDPSKANDQYYIIALLLKHNHPTSLLDEGYDVKPNNIDGNGGCLIVFKAGIDL